MDYESLGGRVKRAFFGKSSTENCLGDDDDKFEDGFFYDSYSDIPVTKSDWHPDSEEVDSNKHTNNNSVNEEEGVDDVGEDEAVLEDEKFDTTHWRELKHVSNKAICFNALSNAIETNLVCARCVSKKEANVGTVKCTEYTNGYATYVYIDCSQCKKRNCDNYKKVTIKPQQKNTTPDEDGNFSDNLGDYVINVQIMLLMYKLGLGFGRLGAIGAYLGLCPSVGKELNWRNLEKSLFETVRAISMACMLENIALELAETASTFKSDATWMLGRLGLFCSWDMGWKKRASGNAYNSLSGVGFLLGGVTKRVLCLGVYSKYCATCSQDETYNRQPTEHWCSNNHGGSSKAMESVGALQAVIKLYNKTGDTYCYGICTDDDSSTRNILQHSFREMYPDDKTKWPRRPKSDYKPDCGKIPLTMPTVEHKYCNKAHCRKTYGSACYKFQQHSKQMTKVNCERMKRNFGVCLLQNTGNAPGANMKTFTTRMKAVLEHAFNNHEFCGDDWCKHMKKNDAELDDVDTKSRFMDKTVGDTYSKLFQMHQQFTTPQALEQCFHSFLSQKNETMNKKMSVTTPKDQSFSRTESLSSRTHLVCIRDSVGEYESVVCIMGHLDFQTVHPTFSKYLLCADNAPQYHRQRRLLVEVKQKTNLAKVTKLREGIQKEAADKKRGCNYGSGMAVEDDNETNEQAEPSSAKGCCRCGATDHSCITFRLCPLNSKNAAATTAGTGDEAM